MSLTPHFRPSRLSLLPLDAERFPSLAMGYIVSMPGY